MTNKALAKLYEVPELKGKKTTGKDAIDYLFFKTGDEVFGKTIEIRSLDTLINNFIPNWEPKKDGRVHTTWGFTAASGQLDSRNPNILNISKHTKNGQRFRRAIVAPDGFKILECDKKSFHVATLGYLADDKDYLRFSQLNPHSIFTSMICPKDWGVEPILLSWSDKDVLEASAEIGRISKKDKERSGVDIRQDIAKPCVLGNQLGLGPRKLYYKNRRAIQSEAHARELQAVIAQMFPKVEKWKSWIIDKADKETYLIDEWGKVQFFFEVFRWNKNEYGRWTRTRTNEAEKVLAFRVQGVAFGMLKYEHLRMEERRINERYNFINSIHDSLVFLPKDNMVSKAKEEIEEIMNDTCERLVNDATGPKGLIVRVVSSIGENMANYHEVKNPGGMREV